MVKLIFIGPQGSGKGTQAAVLSKKLNIPHISTGDLFRNAKDKLKQELDKFMNSGQLVPDELTTKILKQRLEKPDAEKGFILDGFPRNLKQVELLKQITDIDKAILVNISDDEAIKRISGRVSCKDCKEGYNLLTQPIPNNPEICDKCGGKLEKRFDDTEEAVKKRLNIYHQETKPILDAYKDKLITIHGEQSIEKINQDINKELNIN